MVNGWPGLDLPRHEGQLRGRTKSRLVVGWDRRRELILVTEDCKLAKPIHMSGPSVEGVNLLDLRRLVHQHDLNWHDSTSSRARSRCYNKQASRFDQVELLDLELL